MTSSKGTNGRVHKDCSLTFILIIQKFKSSIISLESFFTVATKSAMADSSSGDTVIVWQ